MVNKNIRVYLEAITGDYNAKMGEAAQQTSAFQNTVSGLTGPIRAASAAMAAVGASSILAIRGIVSTGAEYEVSMNRVRGVTGATGHELENLSAAAKEAGATTVFTASQAADALYFLASSGFTAQESIAALPGVIELAVAGQMDLATATDIATNIMSGYGLQAQDLGRVNDILAVTFQGTNTNIAQLGEAMTYVAPVAEAAGMSLEEAASAAGLLGNAGIQGSMGGTTLRAVILGLINPTGEAAETLERLGVNALDSTGQMRPLADILDELAVAGITLADAVELVGVRGGPGLMALLSQGADALRNQTAAAFDAAGTAAEVAGVNMEGFTFAMAELRSALDGLKIALYEAGIGEFATLLVNAITNVVQALAGMPRWVHVVGANILTFNAIVLTTVGVVGVLAAKLIALKLAATMLNVALAKTGVTATLVAMRASVVALGSAFAALATRMGLGALISSLVAGKAALAKGMLAAAAAARTLGLSIQAALGPIGWILAGVTAAWFLYRRRQDEAREAAERFITTWQQAQDLETITGVREAIADLQELEAELAAVAENKWRIAWIGTVEDDKAQLEALRAEIARLSDETNLFEAATNGLDDSVRHVVQTMGVDAVKATASYQFAMESGWGSVIAMEMGVNELVGSMDELQVLAEQTHFNVDELYAMGVTADMTADEVYELAESLDAAALAAQEAEQAWMDVAAQFLDMNQALSRSQDENRQLAEEAAEAHNAAIDSQIEKLGEGEDAARESLLAQKKSWEDYIDDFPETVGQVTKHLEDINQEFRDWQEDIEIISQRVGPAFGEALAMLGPEWADVVSQLVDATPEELARFNQAIVDNIDLQMAAAEMAVQMEVLKGIVRVGVDATLEDLETHLGYSSDIVSRVWNQVQNGLNPLEVEVDIDPAITEVVAAEGRLDEFSTFVAIATVDAHNDESVRKTLESMGLLHEYDDIVAIADIDARIDAMIQAWLEANGMLDQVDSAVARAEMRANVEPFQREWWAQRGLMHEWDAIQATSTLNARDNASRTIASVNRQLNNIPRNITTTINTRHTGGGAFVQHEGGFAGTGPVRGMPEIHRDEVPTILQMGEFVLSRQMVAGLGGPGAVSQMADWASNPRPVSPGIDASAILKAISGGSGGSPAMHVENQNIYDKSDAGLVVDQLEFALSAGRL